MLNLANILLLVALVTYFQSLNGYITANRYAEIKGKGNTLLVNAAESPTGRRNTSPWDVCRLTCFRKIMTERSVKRCIDCLKGENLHLDGTSMFN